MRISDWSSDVCSSDLLPGNFDAVSRWLNAEPLQQCLCLIQQIAGNIAGLGKHCIKIGTGLVVQRRKALVDRKSVVKGKSVSVRVDLGGRRIIKKKTKKKHIRQQDLEHIYIDT